jgi:hypothetical protein
MIPLKKSNPRHCIIGKDAVRSLFAKLLSLIKFPIPFLKKEENEEFFP